MFSKIKNHLLFDFSKKEGHSGSYCLSIRYIYDLLESWPLNSLNSFEIREKLITCAFACPGMQCPLIFVTKHAYWVIALWA